MLRLPSKSILIKSYGEFKKNKKKVLYLGWVGPVNLDSLKLCLIHVTGKILDNKSCLNVSITPLRQWGFRQCLPFSWTTLRGKN
jgi:hypothetical protein